MSRCVVALALLVLALAVPPSAGAATGIAYVQGTVFGTGTAVTSTQANLAGAVAAGDLLVGWFSQYNAAGNVQVSDNVNGAWTRAPASLPFGSTSGDNALYYVQNAKASAAGLTVTIGASAATYLQGTFSEYSGVATSGALDQSATGKGTGTAVTTAATPAVSAGDLVYSALVTGGNPLSASPGSSLGVNYTARAKKSTGSVFSEDITSSAAGAQVGTATLGASTNWIAGVAAFHPAAAAQPPAAPTGLTASSVTASQVVLSWTASTGSPAVTGYVVFRGGSQIGTSTTTGFTDSTVAASTTYSYTVAATNSAGTSPPSSPLSVTTPAPGTAASVTYVQGAAWTTGSRVTSSSSTLAKPVRAGDLLVGWFGQYNVAGQVTVSDSVNGTWTRAPTSLAWQNDTGDIALYYVPSSKAAASGLTVTVSAGGAAYFEATLAEYSGVAAGGPLDQVSSARGVGTATDSGPVAASSAGELVFSASVTGGNPGGVTPGTSQGVQFAPRASTGSGSAYEQDILNGAAGTQHGTSTLLTSTDWYAVAATFHAQPGNSSGPPTAPSGLTATSVSTSRVTLSWTPSSGGVAGYTVYSGGAPLGNVSPGSTTFIDTTVSASSSYSYSVAAFNLSGQYSAMSNAAGVTTPARSPVFVQGIATSPGSRLPSLTLTLSKPVSAGDLLVGWFGQYNAPGQVTVSDNVNGAWTRSGASETWANGTGDIALFTVANSKAAPGGLSVTISASVPAYLQEAIADFSGVATTSPLDQAAVGYSTGTTAIGGPTAATPAGDLVIAAVITGGQPGNITPGSSLGIPYVVDVQNGSASADLEDILSGAAGPQSEHATLGTDGSGSYTVVAAFRPL